MTTSRKNNEETPIHSDSISTGEEIKAHVELASAQIRKRNNVGVSCPSLVQARSLHNECRVERVSVGSKTPPGSPILSEKHPIRPHSHNVTSQYKRKGISRKSRIRKVYNNNNNNNTGYTSGQSNFKSYIFFHPTYFQYSDLLCHRKSSTCGFKKKLITVICFRVRLDGTHLITG